MPPSSVYFDVSDLPIDVSVSSSDALDSSVASAPLLVGSPSERGLHGTFHHVSEKHLNRYVQEFAFRLNEGNCAVDTQDRLDALFGQMPGNTITYKGLIEKA